MSRVRVPMITEGHPGTTFMKTLPWLIMQVRILRREILSSLCEEPLNSVKQLEWRWTLNINCDVINSIKRKKKTPEETILTKFFRFNYYEIFFLIWWTFTSRAFFRNTFRLLSAYLLPFPSYCKDFPQLTPRFSFGCQITLTFVSSTFLNLHARKGRINVF